MKQLGLGSSGKGVGYQVSFKYRSCLTKTEKKCSICKNTTARAGGGGGGVGVGCGGGGVVNQP